MPFPPGWNASVGKGPRPVSGRSQHRIFIDSDVVGAATVNFADRAYLFSQLTGAITVQPTPRLEPGDTSDINYGTTEFAGAFGGGAAAAAFGQAAPVPMMWTKSMRVINDDGVEDLLVSFDGVSIHDRLRPGEIRFYDERNEAGIALASGANTCAFRVIGW